MTSHGAKPVWLRNLSVQKPEHFDRFLISEQPLQHLKIIEIPFWLALNIKIIPNIFQRRLVFDHASKSCHATWNSLRTLSLPLSDACRPSPWSDAHGTRRALFECSELARPPVVCVRPLWWDRAGRQWFWVLLPNQKDLGCRAETRHLSYMLIIPRLCHWAIHRSFPSNNTEVFWNDYKKRNRLNLLFWEKDFRLIFFKSATTMLGFTVAFPAHFWLSFFATKDFSENFVCRNLKLSTRSTRWLPRKKVLMICPRTKKFW